MYLWFLLFHFLMPSTNACSDEAFDPDNFYAYVSTKTAYDVVQGHLERTNPECVPVQGWMLMRHATRHAGVSEIPTFMRLKKFRDNIFKNLKNHRGCLHEAKVPYLKRWRPYKYLDTRYSSALAPKGETEAQQLGKTIRNIFPELVMDLDSITPTAYSFRASDHQRTNETLKSFVTGFFQHENVYPAQGSPETELITGPHKQCPAWDIQANRCNEERNRFTSMPVFQKLIIDISVRLGFQSLLTFDEIYLMYSMCRYEYAWTGMPTIWCMVFTTEEMRIMEYSEDLSYYYACGPVCPLSIKLGCFAMRDMFAHFRNFEKEIPDDYPRFVLHVGHTVSIQIIIMALKVFEREPPITPENYEHCRNRNYRTSMQAPFMANILAVFHKCHGSGDPNKVFFFLNEKPLYLKYCRGHICNWSDLKKKFRKDISTCNRDDC